MNKSNLIFFLSIPIFISFIPQLIIHYDTLSIKFFYSDKIFAKTFDDIVKIKVIIYIIAFFISFFFTCFLKKNKFELAFNNRPQKKYYLIFFFIFILLNIVFLNQYYFNITIIQQIIYNFYLVNLLICIYLSYFYLKNPITFLLFFLILNFLSYYCYFKTGNGGLYFFFIFFYSHLFFIFFFPSKLYNKLIIIIFLILSAFIFYTAKKNFRETEVFANLTKLEQGVDYSKFKSTKTQFGDLYHPLINYGNLSNYKFSYETIKLIYITDLIYNRLSKSHDLAWIIELHTDDNDIKIKKKFKYGSTYLPILTKIIPRIFYKNKPREILSNTLPREYLILPDYDKTTSHHIHSFVEAYMNFGLLGSVILGIFLGLIINFLVFFLKNEKNEFIKFTFLIPLIILFCTLDSNISLNIGGLIYQYLIIFFLYYLIKKKLINVQ